MEKGLADARRILALSAHFILSVNKDSEPFEAVTDETHHVLGVQESLDGPERVTIKVLPLNKGEPFDELSYIDDTGCPKSHCIKIFLFKAKQLRALNDTLILHSLKNFQTYNNVCKHVERSGKRHFQHHL